MHSHITKYWIIVFSCFTLFNSCGKEPNYEPNHNSVNNTDGHQTYAVTVVSNNSEWGSVFGGGTYANGSDISISATPNSGYMFKGWDDGVTQNPRTVYVSGNITYMAMFAKRTSTGGFNSIGASNALFSVSQGRKVRFSRGNLQYQASTGVWKFAEHQYDVIGEGNRNVSSSYSGWIDLFGFGTSGWNSGANEYMPTATSNKKADYYVGGSFSNNLVGQFANADWGVNNSISNGGNMPGMWRTLTVDEWSYLLGESGVRSGKNGLATIEGQYEGLIILPDEFVMPEGLYFISGTGSWTRNTYTMEEWMIMENAGAVFLPSTGYRYLSAYVGGAGYYRSVNYYDDRDVHSLHFSESLIYPNAHEIRSRGIAVRLVKND